MPSSGRARQKPRKTSLPHALGVGKSFASRRWTLVDHFESNGRRYVLVAEMEPGADGALELSPRERQVLTLAAQARSNKEIAHALGLAHSTVRVLFTRAARKLGASSRAQLLERFDALNRGSSM
ncbi:MAG TPA: helix-turn-helix transcriptional regulator [Polyangiaceae bacterium]|nr:helix-turn-helix transcriptional regulator [Polyangiaceae bacterium]